MNANTNTVDLVRVCGEYLVTTRISQAVGHSFKTEGKVLVKPGWLAIYGKEAEDERMISSSVECRYSLSSLVTSTPSKSRFPMSSMRFRIWSFSSRGDAAFSIRVNLGNIPTRINRAGDWLFTPILFINKQNSPRSRLAFIFRVFRSSFC